jgi:hypothetical protein
VQAGVAFDDATVRLFCCPAQALVVTMLPSAPDLAAEVGILVARFLAKWWASSSAPPMESVAALLTMSVAAVCSGRRLFGYSWRRRIVILSIYSQVGGRW